ncbi:MAG TPA: thermonuclease family protein [Methylomirabilota bacterium]
MVLAVLVLGAGSAAAQEPGRGRSLPAAVVKVLSGDTIHVFVNGEVERVRYIGVVAPEPGEADQSGEPQGNEALRFNLGLVSAKNVRLELDVQERDAEGRLLAYVWLGDVMANAEVIARGYGQVVSGSPNVRYQDMLLRRQQEARTARLGIWRTAGPAPPPARSGPAAPEPRTAQGRPGQPPSNGWTCPLSHPIKGDFRTYSSERCIYYPPGTPTYAESRTDRCYATEDEARQDGCRRSRR